MQIDPLHRRVELSVRELAIFRNHPTDTGQGYSPWRASVGQQWHQSLAAESLSVEPNVKVECSVQIDWLHREWCFKLNGRIDQILEEESSNELLIREVKTIRSPLPAPEESLIHDFVDYFAQVSIYKAMLETLPEHTGKSLSAEVLFVNIENGARQSVTLQSSEYELFEQQLEALYPFLEERRNSHHRIQQADIKPAFESLRDGQENLLETLHEAALKAQIVLMEAPTGFGKTGIVLEHALKHMQSGVYDRCIYLSSKSTGQIQTIEQLQRMIGGSLHFIQMRNRKEHAMGCQLATCTGDRRCNEGFAQNWLEADIDPPRLFDNGTLSLTSSKTIGAKTGVCPYELTKGCLPYAEIWVGDSNYIFSPESRSVFVDVDGFDPARTLLVVDEAHNLPSRTEDSLSLEVDSGDLLFAIEELGANGAARRLLSIGNEICRWIETLPKEHPLNPNELYTGQDLCEEFSQQLADSRLDFDSTAPFALEIAWRIPRLAQCLAASSDEYLNWCPRAGLLKATCIDASGWIMQCLKPFAGSILMSATLQPFSTYRQACGIPTACSTEALGVAFWRDEAYQVAIDTRVDTRLRHRETYYEKTATTIALSTQFSPGIPVAVFFSSYQYADNVMAYLEALSPELRINRQPRGGQLSEQSNFIEESLLTSDAIFLILGSSYSEGIDQLGGRVNQVIIVGPALPEVNLVQKTKMEQHSALCREEAFRDVYIRPAMRRIHQALGRIVRAPGQRARVLLHCQRFAEPAYADELASEYRTEHTIDSDQKLIEWLQVVD